MFFTLRTLANYKCYTSNRHYYYSIIVIIFYLHSQSNSQHPSTHTSVITILLDSFFIIPLLFKNKYYKYGSLKYLLVSHSSMFCSSPCLKESSSLIHMTEVLKFHCSLGWHCMTSVQFIYPLFCQWSHDSHSCYTALSLTVCTHGFIRSSLSSMDKGKENLGPVCRCLCTICRHR